MPSIHADRSDEKNPIVILENDAGETLTVPEAEYLANGADFYEASFLAPARKPTVPNTEDKLAAATKQIEALTQVLIDKAVVSKAEIDAAAVAVAADAGAAELKG